MKIVSWNCNRAFRNKYKYILEYSPDIMVIQESEQPDKFDDCILDLYPNRVWHGDNPNMGVLVLSKEEYQISIKSEHNSDHKFIIPVDVRGQQSFTLFAVWAQKSKGISYSQHVLAALVEYEILFNQECILIGDFNSSSIWDKKQSDSKHSQIVEFLEKNQIKSSYHVSANENMGEESLNTHALYRNSQKMYNLDYCFASQALLKTMKFQIPAVEKMD